MKAFSPDKDKSDGNLSTVVNLHAHHRGIVTRSPLMEALLAQARQAAQSRAAVLIRGESGTGKELLARAIHEASPRRHNPFIALNCAAVPEHLLESELFGHKKGAFTGALHDHKGLFRAADGGTLFLDEVGDMPQSFQAKLLRAIQEKRVRPVGATEDTPVDVRIIAATHIDLEKAVTAGDFREDLYDRLDVIALTVPSLTERREDIPLLAAHFLSRLTGEKRFTAEALDSLARFDWPGNVRQLQNVVERCAALCEAPVITADRVGKALPRKELSALPPLREAKRRFERDYLARLLRITQGNVSRAARLAQRNRTEMYKLLGRHGLEPAQFKH